MTESLLDEVGRWDEDDFPEEEHAADLGEPDDDEPRSDDPDEMHPVLPDRPEIAFWRTPSGIGWEIRPTSAATADDDAHARLALLREERLRRYAVGLITDCLRPHLLSAELSAIWDALPVEIASTSYEREPRWLEDAETGERIPNPQAGRYVIDPETGGTKKGNIGLEDEERWNTGIGSLSADRALLIGLPSGRLLPLQFFTWKGESDGMVRDLAGDTGLLTEPAARVLARLFPRTDARNRAKHLLPWVRAAVSHPRLVTRYRTLFRTAPARFESVLKRFSEDLIAAEVERAERDGVPAPGMDPRRGQPVLHRAIVGGIR